MYPTVSTWRRGSSLSEVWTFSFVIPGRHWLRFLKEMQRLGEKTWKRWTINHNQFSSHWLSNSHADFGVPQGVFVNYTITQCII